MECVTQEAKTMTQAIIWTSELSPRLKEKIWVSIIKNRCWIL